jgi:hypothetical protein
MYRIVHKELKYTADVPAGRSVGFYSDAACTSLLSLVDKDGTSTPNPVVMIQGATCEVFLLNPVRQVWAKSDYIGDVARPVALVPDFGTGGSFVIDQTNTLAELNAGTSAIVPSRTGKQIIVDNFWQAIVGSNLAGATLVRLVEETSSNVVMSHVIADYNSNAWVTKAGGTVVTTYLEKPLVAAKAVLLDKTGSTATGPTAIRTVAIGRYI